MGTVDSAEDRTGSTATDIREGERVRRWRPRWPSRLAASAFFLFACGQGAEGVDPDAPAGAGAATAEAEAPAEAPEVQPPTPSDPATPSDPKTRGPGPEEAGDGDLTRVPDPDELDLHDPENDESGL